MPAIVVFGRRWHLAADDLPIPSVLGAIWHAFWLIVISGNLAYVDRHLDGCWYQKQQTRYLSVQAACFAINFVLHSWTLYESTRGG